MATVKESQKTLPSKINHEASLQGLVAKLGKEFEKHKSSHSVMSEEEKERNEHNRQLYKLFGLCIQQQAVGRNKLLHTSYKTILEACQELSDIEDDVFQRLKEYDTIKELFENYAKVVKRNEAAVNKAYESRIAAEQLKKKQKKKLFERKQMSKLQKSEEQFEDVKRLTLFVEHSTLNEMDYVRKKIEDSFPHQLEELVLKHHNYHQKMLAMFEQLIKKLKIREREKEYEEPYREELEKIVNPRTSLLPKDDQVLLGMDLEKVMSRTDETLPIPKAVSALIVRIKKHLTTEGIFRKAGSADKLHMFMWKLDTGRYEDAIDGAPLVLVTSGLKEYVRSLPNSFCPFSNFEKFFSAFTKKGKIKAIQEGIKKLNTADGMLFYSLFYLFQKVHNNSDTNLMPAKNIATVWAINIFRHPETYTKNSLGGKLDTEKLKRVAELTSQMNNLFTFIVENFEKVYKKNPTKPKYKKKTEIKPPDDDEVIQLQKKYLKNWKIPSLGGFKSEHIVQDFPLIPGGSTASPQDLAYRSYSDQKSAKEEGATSPRKRMESDAGNTKQKSGKVKPLVERRSRSYSSSNIFLKKIPPPIPTSTKPPAPKKIEMKLNKKDFVGKNQEMNENKEKEKNEGKEKEEKKEENEKEKIPPVQVNLVVEEKVEKVEEKKELKKEEKEEKKEVKVEDDNVKLENELNNNNRESVKSIEDSYYEDVEVEGEGESYDYSENWEEPNNNPKNEENNEINGKKVIVM